MGGPSQQSVNRDWIVVHLSPSIKSFRQLFELGTRHVGNVAICDVVLRRNDCILNQCIASAKRTGSAGTIGSIRGIATSSRKHIGIVNRSKTSLPPRQCW
jgi:hypothetical protein